MDPDLNPQYPASLYVNIVPFPTIKGLLYNNL